LRKPYSCHELSYPEHIAGSSTTTAPTIQGTTLFSVGSVPVALVLMSPMIELAGLHCKMTGSLPILCKPCLAA
jgi:hypothetical protein